MTKGPSILEAELAFQIKALNLPTPKTEYQFAAEHVGAGPGIQKRLKAQGLRNWRFDFAWPQLMFAVEVEGITVGGGRHQRIGGFKEDIEKYHHAMDMGWTVYRCTGHLIKDGRAIQIIKKFMWHLARGKEWDDSEQQC